MASITATDEGRQFNIALSGSLVNLLLVGLVSWLKDRKNIRIIAGCLGLLAVAIGSVFFVMPVYSEFLDSLRRLSTALLIGGSVLLFSVVLSGSRFNVYIGERPEVEERKEAEAKVQDSRDPFAALELATKRLNEYYAINQGQARGSFRWAIFAMLLGLSTIVGGVWLFYLKSGIQDIFLTSLSTAAGVVVNAISGLYVYLHNKTQKRSLLYYGQLVRIQQLGLAIRIAESFKEEQTRVLALDKVIVQVLDIVRTTSELDAHAAHAESE